jgi:hypothetical protein
MIIDTYTLEMSSPEDSTILSHTENSFLSLYGWFSQIRSHEFKELFQIKMGM